MFSAKSLRALVRCLLVAVILVAFGCSKGEGDQTQGDGARPGPTDKREEPAPAKPDVSLSSKAFIEEFRKNPDALKGKYRNKWIELTGVVKSFGRDLLGKDSIVLEGAGNTDLGVGCCTKEKAPWKKAVPGQTAKVCGKLMEESFLRPELEECRIAEVTGPGPVAVSLETFSGEFGANEKEADKKYRDKYVQLTGEIAAVRLETGVAREFARDSVTLKTPGNSRPVECTFESFQSKTTGNLQAGQKVSLLGKCAGGGATVRITNCILLDPAP
jgi:hypothetical protein